MCWRVEPALLYSDPNWRNENKMKTADITDGNITVVAKVQCYGVYKLSYPPVLN